MASPKAMRSALHSQLPVDGAGYSYASITLGDHRPYSACGDAMNCWGAPFMEVSLRILIAVAVVAVFWHEKQRFFVDVKAE